MNEYGYSYKQDSSDEIIGYIKASSYEAAQKKLTIIKHLDIDSIDRLFNITEIISHEKQGRRY
jgi:hypothetical protein|tara:strand:- start:732 stop:920 length:189 start_codon:yes stop_codon:yes gene_type:complete